MSFTLTAEDKNKLKKNGFVLVFYRNEHIDLVHHEDEPESNEPESFYLSGDGQRTSDDYSTLDELILDMDLNAAEWQPDESAG